MHNAKLPSTCMILMLVSSPLTTIARPTHSFATDAEKSGADMWASVHHHIGLLSTVAAETVAMARSSAGTAGGTFSLQTILPD